jgi:hypothetical protein
MHLQLCLQLISLTQKLTVADVACAGCCIAHVQSVTLRLAVYILQYTDLIMYLGSVLMHAAAHNSNTALH